MSDIFISYSRYDSNVVNELVALLEQEGYSVWIDRDGIESGDDFKRVILKAIKESKVVLFFSSEHSNVSDWTAKEIGVAVKYKKHIIPIMLDDSNFNEAVEFDLINLDYVDYSKTLTRSAMRERLFKTLRNKIGLGSKESERLEDESKDKGAAERVRLGVEQAVAEVKRLAREVVEMERLEEERRVEEARLKAKEERMAKERAEAERLAKEAAERKRLEEAKRLEEERRKAEQERKATEKKQKKARQETINSFEGHEYVDLGLPSGTLWATCNIGASKPEDYGDYYAWGEVRPKTEYNMKTYKYSKEEKRLFSKYTHLTKYYNESSVLQPSDDPATINWGDGWQMPTKKQLLELMKNTISTWETRNGVFGRLFTATNGASLFIPAAGYRYEGGLVNAGSYGYYWSSSRHTDYPSCAWYFYIYSGNTGMSHYDRSRGHPVRAVRSVRQKRQH